MVDGGSSRMSGVAGGISRVTASQSPVELSSPVPDRRAGTERSTQRKSLTIGSVCKVLKREFPDVSISKLRYLEDQKLLTPRRTQGGYRLYSQAEVDRLRTILRLQRDEFLPLRVIRQELVNGRAVDSTAQEIPEGRPPRRTAVSVKGEPAQVTLRELVDETGADEKLVRELEEYGVIRGRKGTGSGPYDDADREIVRAVTDLARYGVAARNLKAFRSSAQREAALLEQILGPGLRSRNPARRKDALETLEDLAAVTAHLKHLLLIGELREIAVGA